LPAVADGRTEAASKAGDCARPVNERKRGITNNAVVLILNMIADSGDYYAGSAPWFTKISELSLLDAQGDVSNPALHFHMQGRLAL